MGQLDGKIALVTGSAHSIGKAIAIGLARAGAGLVLADKDVPAMQETEKVIADLGGPVEAVSTDVTEEKQIEAAFAWTMERFGRLDVLVNNAGIFYGAPLDEMTTEGWDRLIATSLRGPFLCTRAAFRIMKKQGGGRIINISSVSAIRVRANNAAYNTAKFGLVGLTHSTALDGRKFGINCGCIFPGEVRTDRMAANMPARPPEVEMTTDEIAASVVYMACQPPHVNILELVQLAREQPFMGRG
jgi:NAD(P)-dependent dehydrogenase (short-subunit alcohol dehydrogenase family)